MSHAPTEQRHPVERDSIPDASDEEASFKMLMMRKIQTTHSQMPGVRKVPLRAIGIIVLIAVINTGVWICMGIILVSHGQFCQGMPG